MAKSGRGFAGMSLEKRTAIARKGGRGVPADKRSFAQDASLAAAAGRKGGLRTQARFRDAFEEGGRVSAEEQADHDNEQQREDRDPT